MSYTTKIAAGVMLAAAASTALTGCAKKSSTTTSSTSKSPSMSSSASNSTSSMSSPSGTSTTKAGYVQGVINGKTKNLRAGDQCQSKYASQYTQYGFTCAPKTSGGTAYYLTKN